MMLVNFSGQNVKVTEQINTFLADTGYPGLKMVVHHFNTCYTEPGCMLVNLIFSYEKDDT